MKTKPNAYYRGPATALDFDEPLTVAEENELFRRFYDGGDLAARDEIIRFHLGLTAKIALRTARKLIPNDEAISAGNFGLMKALDSHAFDPERGSRFGSYLRFFIRKHVILAIKQKVDPYGLGTHEELPGGIESVVDKQAEPEYVTASDSEFVQRLLGTLPKDVADMFTRYFFKKQTFREIASALGVSRQAVEQGIDRWCGRLRKKSIVRHA